MKRQSVAYMFVLVAVSSLIAFHSRLEAAEYQPDKNIEFVVHGGAGGAGDIFVRTVAHMLNNEGIVKPKIFVSNKMGGGSAVAINYLVSKKGDPNVLMHWTTSPIVAILRGTTTVKNTMDMTFISSLVEDPLLLVVRTDSKYKNLKDLIEDARKNPDRVKGGISSAGGTEHLVASRIEKATGVKFNITSFPTSCITALLGGHIEFTFGSVQETGESIKAKKIKALAAAGDKRTDFASDAPTMKEQGVDAAFTQLRGFWAPPEIPGDAIKFWDTAFAKLAYTKEFKDYVKNSDMDLAVMGAEQLKKFIPDYARELEKDLNALDLYGAKK